MIYDKVRPRNWSFNCALSGMHPDWSFSRAREFATLAQEVGIEPWSVFPGTRQVTMECYTGFTPLQLSLFSEKVEKDKKLAKRVSKIWSSGDWIYINYVGETDDDLAAKLPDFKVDDVLRHLVSDEIITVTEVGDDYYTVREISGYTHRISKNIVKCGYKLKKKR